MAKPKSTKSTSYTDEEVAFIIFYADYCLHSGAEYKKTLATELEKVSGRSRSWSALRTKIKSIVGQYGKIATQTPAGFIEQGTACLNMDELPADVVDEILSQRAEWGFVTSDSDGIASPKRAASAMDESIDTIEPEAEPEKRPVTKQRAKPPRIDEDPERTPSPSPSDAPPVAEHPTVSDHVPDSLESTSRDSTSATEHARPGASRKRAAEPTDDSDDDEPPLKKAKYPRVIAKAGANKRTAAALDESDEISDIDVVEYGSLWGARPASEVRHSGMATELLTTTFSKQRPTREKSASAKSAEKRKKAATTPMGAPVIASKRRSQEEDDADMAQASKRRRTHASNGSLEKQVGAILKITHWLVRRSYDIGEDMTTDENKHLQALIRTVEREPDELFDKLLEDLRAEQRLTTQYRERIHRTIGNAAIHAEFPPRPDQRDLQFSWSGFREHIVWAAGRTSRTPTPSLTSSAFLSARIEDIAYGRVPEDQLQPCIEDIREFLISPHAQQSLLSALFCRWVFENPEDMCKDMYAESYLALLRGISLSDGLSQVEHFDKVTLHSLTRSSDFKGRRIEPRKRKLERSFKKATASICTPHPQNAHSHSSSSEVFADTAIELKQALLLSPHDYRIHYARPGTKFDKSWMIAVDNEHWEIKENEVEGKEVSMCLFPALMAQAPPDFEDTAPLEEALVLNKNFFPAFGEKPIDEDKEKKKRPICKAYVLILDYKKSDNVAVTGAGRVDHQVEDEEL